MESSQKEFLQRIFFFNLKKFFFFVKKKVLKILSNKKFFQIKRTSPKFFFPNFKAHSLSKSENFKDCISKNFLYCLKTRISVNKKLYQKAISGFNSLILIRSTNILENTSFIPNQTISMYFTFSTIYQYPCLSLFCFSKILYSVKKVIL